ncbi:PX domain-containing [Lecanosticta acicola]|uniref:PX domain-containing n=1 Tax=Lecanosticta acicola TaxID=111012 RepID=A0AAI8Z1J7_9PEZI|nr:PX domain-containing [Lecanosticta acicola]
MHPRPPPTLRPAEKLEVSPPATATADLHLPSSHHLKLQTPRRKISPNHMAPARSTLLHAGIATAGASALYSEFDRLRQDLVNAFPHAEAMIPELPRKSVVSRFRPKFLDQRKNGLSHFLNCILLNPEFASSPMVKDFIFN